MALFERVSKQHPCPVCGKPDWCQVGDRAVKCMRTPSEHACEQGGGWWHHDLSLARKQELVSSNPLPRAEINAAGMMRRWRQTTTTLQFTILAEQLGVLSESLIALGAAWAPPHQAWAFPMQDGHGETIGIRLRAVDGRKWAVGGSRQGLFIPNASVKVPADRTAYFPEGPTSTAAMLSMGFYAIGRPSCMGGEEHAQVAIKRLGFRRAVVMADRDKVVNMQQRPGITGARQFAGRLKVWHVIFMFPKSIKDAREFLSSGGAKVTIESEVKQKTWSR